MIRRDGSGLPVPVGRQGGGGDEAQGKDIYVFGSADLLASPLAAGLVEEYRLCVVPVVLGGGNPLFKPQDRQVGMRLESARPLTTGGVILTYAVGG